VAFSGPGAFVCLFVVPRMSPFRSPTNVVLRGLEKLYCIRDNFIFIVVHLTYSFIPVESFQSFFSVEIRATL